MLACHGIATSMDGLLARCDNVLVEHAYETVSDARVSIG